MDAISTYKIVNSLGLILDIIGVLLVFIHSPILQSVTYMYSIERNEEFRKTDKKKNNRAKLGLILIIIGFLIQISSNFI